MLCQAVLQAECLTTYLTAEGLFTRVISPVAQEVRNPAEGSATLKALKGPGSRVYCLVSSQPAMAAQSLPTCAANERMPLCTALALLP